MKPNAITMAYGVVIFGGTLAAWLYGETHGIDTNIVWAVSTPLILALFLGQAVGEAAEAAKQAANQTNGALDGRVKSAVASALGDRDAARTRQALGDIAGAEPARAIANPETPLTPR